MKRPNNYIISLIVFSLMSTLSTQVFGEERIGDLVFQTMRKIETRQATFSTDARQIREERNKAIKEKEGAKRNYLQSKEGTLGTWQILKYRL